MPKLALLAAAVILAAGCSDSGSDTATGPTVVPGATAGLPTTTVQPAAGAAATTAPAAPTTAPPETTTATQASGEALFVIDQVTFGENGFVQVSNRGSAPGDLSGHWVCQRPNYFELSREPLELAPGEAIWLAPGDGAALDVTNNPSVVAVVPMAQALGDFGRSSGEIALYAGPDFGTATAIRAFVTWSEPGGLPRFGRAGVAVEAGIWTSSGLVEVPTEGLSIALLDVSANGPDGWVADFGG